MAEKEKAFNYSLLARVFGYTRPYTSVFLWAVLFTILVAILSPIRPWLVQYIIDHSILAFNPKKLANLTLIMFGLLLLQSGIQYLNAIYINKLGQYVIHDLRRDVFRNVLNFRLKYFDKTPVGQLVTRSVSDLETIADIFSEGIIVIIGDILQLLAIMIVMFYTDWGLTLAVLLPIPLLIVASYVFKEAIKVAFQDVRTYVARLNTFIQEHVTGMSVVQNFAREEQEYQKFMQINAEHRNAHIRSNWYYSIFFPVVEIISAISIGLLVWYGSKQILSYQISAGVVISFIMYINMMFRPIRELADKFNTLQMGMVGAERVFNVLDAQEHTLNLGTITASHIRGDISFEAVSFEYTIGQPILKNISFNVKAGEVVALVGATGAGKTSIINILNRFYEFEKGKVTVDGVDIRDYELSFLRSHIAVVLQDVFLFSGTVAQNIGLKDPNVSLLDIEKATQEIGADEFINKLPNTYNYQVSERGATLSAGQAQLLSFARALITHPSILILDEATASVDTESEQIIQKGIEKLMQNRTCIVIAHRLSTIQKADKIIVLDKGEIKEIGTHQELLQRENGYYKKLHDLQFKSAGIVV